MDNSCSQGLLKSDLLNRLALNLDTAEEFGSITEIWVNGRTHQVKGIGCSSGLLGRQSHQFLWSQVASLGRDGVVIKAGTRVDDDQELLHDCLPLGDLEVWSDHGDRVGQLVDACFDPATGTMLQYLFMANPNGPLTAGLYGLDPGAVISTGRRRMMVEATQLVAATLIEAGVQLPPAPSPVRRTLEHLPLDHLADPRRRWEATLETTRQAREQIAEQWQERRQKLQHQAQDRWGRWLGDVKKRTRRLRHQLRETVTDVTADLSPGQGLRNDPTSTIDVEAMELWAQEEDSSLPR